MEKFNFFTHEELSIYCKPRKGETKFGEALTQVNSFEALEQNKAKYAIIGIPEDIGVQANFGKKGTKNAWEEFLKAFLNIQINPHNQPDNCIILGQIDCEGFLNDATYILEKEENPEEKLGEIVSKIDDLVTEVVYQTVKAGKIPVIVGGGHNNAFGNIKGVSKALDRPINVMNIEEIIEEEIRCNCCLTNENVKICKLENCDYPLCVKCFEKVPDICPKCRRKIKKPVKEIELVEVDMDELEYIREVYRERVFCRCCCMWISINNEDRMHYVCDCQKMREYWNAFIEVMIQVSIAMLISIIVALGIAIIILNKNETFSFR